MTRKKHPTLERLTLKIRNRDTGRENFREALEKIGEYIGYEIARTLETEKRETKTCMGETATHYPNKGGITLITIFRAGLPLYQGLQKTFPEAESGFIGAMRDEKTLKSKISYLALPALEGKTILLADTMLATGGSIIDCIEILKQQKPKEIRVVAAIASKKGIERIKTYDPNLKIYSAAIDYKLNEKGYIIPGLGDAGDRCFGRKE